MRLHDNKSLHSSKMLRHSHLTAAVLLGIYSACLASSVYAMQAVDEQTMSDTTGADGMVINVQATNVAADHAYWADPNSSGTGALDLQGISIRNNADASLATPTTPFKASVTVNTGSSGTTPALSLNLNVNTQTLFTAQSLVLCGGVTSGTPSSCSTAAGAAPSGAVQLLNGTTNGVMSTSPLTASLTTTNGFLNSNGTATVRLLLSNGNIFFTSNGTQLVTSDIYANIAATGRIWVDATDGFRFSTSGVTGGRVTLTSPYASDTAGSWGGTSPVNGGLQYSLVMQTPSVQGGTLNQLKNAATTTTFGTTTSGSGLTFGVSGNIPTLDLSVRGASATGMTTDGVGGTTSVGGTVGSVLGNANGGNAIAMNMTGNIQNGGAASGFTPNPSPTTTANSMTNLTPGAFKLYFGASGPYGYGIQMTNFVPFGNVTASASTANPSFTSGNVYVNLLTSSTKQLAMPISNVFAGNSPNTVNYFNSGLAGASGSLLTDAIQVQNNQVLDLQTLPTLSSSNGGNLFFAIRGLSIQGVPLITNFYQNGVGVCNGITSCNGAVSATNSAPINTFSVMPVINNLNTNITLSAASATDIANQGATKFPGLTEALNYSFAISITGNNGGSEGTGSSASGTSGSLQESALLMVDTNSNQYVGLRDVNLYLKADGLLVLQGTATSNSFNLTFPHFMLVAKMGLAAGYLPGAEGSAPSFVSNKDTAMIISLGLTSDQTNNKNNYLSFTDNQGTSNTNPNSMTFGLNLTLAGTAQATAVPISCSNAAQTVFNCTGTLTSTSAASTSIPVQTTLAGGNFFRIMDNSGSAALGLDNITGTINASARLTPGSMLYNSYNPYNLTSTTPTQVNSLTITSTLQINPSPTIGNELLTTLNFYPNGGTAMPLGKMVLTGGQIISNLTLTPVSVP